MFFLFQRVQQLARAEAAATCSAAPSFPTSCSRRTALFARLTLADDELRLYEQMHDQLKPATAAPDLVIYLQARPETLVERVGRRGNPIESGISEAYLRALADSYTRFFHEYDAAPVLIVNTEHLNLVDRDEDFDLLLDRIGKLRGRREYFNLAA